MRVLVVEDDRRVAEVIGATLHGAGYEVVTAATRAGADAALDGSAFEVAVVDVGLPDGSGIELCRAARARGLDVPILLLTARNGVDDRVAGLDAGADDYLGKPFAPAELSARVRALGRRGPRWIESTRRFGELALDRDRRTVTRAGAKVPLTPREFDVVAVLAWRNGRVIARDELLELVWGEVTDGAAASLEVLVARVRRKLDDHETSCIRTIRSVGYAWALPASNPD